MPPAQPGIHRKPGSAIHPGPAPQLPEGASPAEASSSSFPGAGGSLPARLVLTGFMGAGKTTVGNLLARRLSYRFLDADAEIEAAAGATIAEIFARDGESAFRELEHQTIRNLLGCESLVLALGGGAIEDPRTCELLLGSAYLIHLEASLDTVLLRCRGTEPLRPILRDRAGLDGRYARRLPLYRQAHVNIPVDTLSPGGVVSAIVESLAASGQLPTAPR